MIIGRTKPEPHYRLSDMADEARKLGAVLSSADVCLIGALAQRMEHDPKHMVHAIQGHWFWSDDIDAEDLWNEAYNRMDDLIEIALIDQKPTNSVQILNVIAAYYAAWLWIDIQREQQNAYDAAEEYLASRGRAA